MTAVRAVPEKHVRYNSIKEYCPLDNIAANNVWTKSNKSYLWSVVKEASIHVLYYGYIARYVSRNNRYTKVHRLQRTAVVLNTKGQTILNWI